MLKCILFISVFILTYNTAFKPKIDLISVCIHKICAQIIM